MGCVCLALGRKQVEKPRRVDGSKNLLCQSVVLNRICKRIHQITMKVTMNNRIVDTLSSKSQSYHIYFRFNLLRRVFTCLPKDGKLELLMWSGIAIHMKDLSTCIRMLLAGHLLLCSSTSLFEPTFTCWSKKLVIGQTLTGIKENKVVV